MGIGFQYPLRLDVHDQNGIQGLLDHGAVAFLVFQQKRFGRFLFGDVPDRSHDVLLAVAIDKAAFAGHYNPFPPPAVGQPFFIGAVSSGLKNFVVPLPKHSRLFRRMHIGIGPADQLFPRMAPKLAKGIVDQNPPMMAVLYK